MLHRESGFDRGNVALVTGAGRRIGRVIALTLGRAGFRVVIHANRSLDDAEGVAAEIAKAGGRAAVILADLADHAETVGLVPRAADVAGPLTLLVNNASEFEADEVGRLERAQWDRHFAVNLRAPVFLAEAFAAQTPAGRDAAIVNILDQRVHKPTPRQFSYTLTKAALHTATTTLAQALAPRVRVNAVSPGPTLQSPRQHAVDFDRQARALPLERNATPEDVAAAVLFLAQAQSVTGETITVDGGQHVAWKTPDVWGIAE